MTQVWKMFLVRANGVQAPVALDIRSPIDLAYECFVKLGLRYICVLRDGKYAGMVSYNPKSIISGQRSSNHGCTIDSQKDIRQVYSRTRRRARWPLRGTIDVDVGNCISIENKLYIRRGKRWTCCFACIFMAHLVWPIDF